MAYTKTIETLTVKKLLEFLALEGVTGHLSIYKGNVRGHLFFRDGRILYADHSDRRDDTLARRLVASGVSEDAVREALKQQGRDEELRPLGDILVDQGITEREAILRAQAERTTEVVREMLGWSQGFYQFDLVDEDSVLDVAEPDLVIRRGIKIRLPKAA